MWRIIFSLIAWILLLGGLILLMIPFVKPDFSRQGKIVLINGKDTAVITREEPVPPSWTKRKREVTVRYKDNLGVYHEESFPENEITEIH